MIIDDKFDWKSVAEVLKFDEGLSWTEVYATMKPLFPELTDKQIEEKIRGALRKSDKYHAPTANIKSKDHFTYTSENDVHVYIISDVHIGAHGFQKKAFERYIGVIEQDPLAVVLLLGDLMDNATLGSKGCVFSQRMMPQKQIETITDMLVPISEKIIFMCDGNHEERTFRNTGSDPGHTIGIGLFGRDGIANKYNYVHGFITITAKGKTYKLYATHNIGKGECKLKAMARAHPDCDIIVGGHIHSAKVVPTAQQLHSGKVKTTYAVVGKAWLKDESYSISAAYEPVSDVQPMIMLGDTISIIQ